MKIKNLQEELASTSYPGRGIIIGRSEDGKKAVIAYFIMAAVKTAATVSLWQRATA